MDRKNNRTEKKKKAIKDGRMEEGGRIKRREIIAREKSINK